ncbi:MAG: hypothetical protein K8L97_29200 [Anaerolineae bacterium]|nr:hypothetical protein [Anaerolineae bacterium]
MIGGGGGDGGVAKKGFAAIRVASFQKTVIAAAAGDSKLAAAIQVFGY